MNSPTSKFKTNRWMICLASLAALVLYFPTTLLGKNLGKCSLEDYFIETQIAKSEVIFFGEIIKSQKAWDEGYCGDKPASQCTNWRYKNKVKVLEVYKGSPPSIFTYYTFNQLPKPSDGEPEVRLVTTYGIALDIDLVFYGYKTGSGWNELGQCRIGLFDRIYLSSRNKNAKLNDSFDKLNDWLIKNEFIEKKWKKSKAPNPFSPKASPPEPPFSEKIPQFFQQIFKERRNSRAFNRGFNIIYVRPLGELFSLWTSIYPEFEKEIAKRLESSGYKPENPLPNSETLQRDQLRLWALSLSGSSNIETRRKILPILFADFESEKGPDFNMEPPNKWQVATYYLAKTGLPEVKTYMKAVAEKEGPKQHLAQWALDQLNSPAKSPAK